MTEKELNCHLLDLLDLIDDIQEAAETDQAETVLRLLAKKRKQINRKLYQKPPLLSEE